MRLAFLADIHGNSIALDAVLADIQAAGGVDGYWILGDIAAVGHDPVGVMERLAELPFARYIRGNTDRFLYSGERPFPTIEDTRQNPELISVLAEVSGSFGWTQGALVVGGWLDWLAKLPLERRLTLPDGKRLLAVHAAPGQDDGDGIHLASTNDEISALLHNCGADMVTVGHTHCVFDRTVNGVHVINPGSVSNGFLPDLRASYALLDCSAQGVQVEFRRADYDRQAVIDSLAALHYPGAPYITAFMEGKVQSGWLKRWLAMQENQR